MTPHVSQNNNRPGGSAIDGRTTRHAGYQVSQRKRKRIEEVFGWLKTVGMLRKTRHRGIFKVGWVFTFAASGLQSGADEEPCAWFPPHKFGEKCARTHRNREFKGRATFPHEPHNLAVSARKSLGAAAKLVRATFSSSC